MDTKETTDIDQMTGDQLTSAMAALEDSGKSYEQCAAEYEALSAARNKTDWMPDWMRVGEPKR